MKRGEWRKIGCSRIENRGSQRESQRWSSAARGAVPASRAQRHRALPRSLACCARAGSLTPPGLARLGPAAGPELPVRGFQKFVDRAPLLREPRWLRASMLHVGCREKAASDIFLSLRVSTTFPLLPLRSSHSRQFQVQQITFLN